MGRASAGGACCCGALPSKNASAPFLRMPAFNWMTKRKTLAHLPMPPQRVLPPNSKTGDPWSMAIEPSASPPPHGGRSLDLVALSSRSLRSAAGIAPWELLEEQGVDAPGYPYEEATHANKVMTCTSHDEVIDDLHPPSPQRQDAFVLPNGLLLSPHSAPMPARSAHVEPWSRCHSPPSLIGGHRDASMHAPHTLTQQLEGMGMQLTPLLTTPMTASSHGPTQSLPQARGLMFEVDQRNGMPMRRRHLPLGSREPPILSSKGYLLHALRLPDEHMAATAISDELDVTHPPRGLRYEQMPFAAEGTHDEGLDLCAPLAHATAPSIEAGADPLRVHRQGAGSPKVGKSFAGEAHDDATRGSPAPTCAHDASVPLPSTISATVPTNYQIDSPGNHLAAPDERSANKGDMDLIASEVCLAAAQHASP